MIAELAELNRIRLERNLSFQALADEVGLPMRTLHRMLTTPDARAYDRTLHKIRRYLASQGDGGGHVSPGEAPHV